MSKKIVFLKPYLEQKIWGGTNAKEFNYNSDFKNIGEVFLISAFKSKASFVIETNIPFYKFYECNKDFFNNYHGDYPLLTKLIDAHDNLSIQVHPDNDYAVKSKSKGKAECWYIIDAEEDSEIIVGTSCKNKSELLECINNKTLLNNLHKIKVQKGDFLYIEPGTIHSIGRGILLYELQQNSDITYRIYDFDRVDDNGFKRELHLEDALNVINYHNKPIVNHKTGILIDNSFFTLHKIDINGEQKMHFPDANWVEVFVLSGNGHVDEYKVTKGSIFLIRHNEKFTLKGEMEVLISYIKKH